MTTPTPTPAPAPQPRKGLPVLAWVGIGCGGLIVLTIVIVLIAGVFLGKAVKDFSAEAEKNPARAAASLITKFNSDLEIVGSDDAAGTVTIRQISTGEEITLNSDEIQNGRLSFKSVNGNTEITTSSSTGGGQVNFTDAAGATSTVTTTNLPDWVSPLLFAPNTAVEPGFVVTNNGHTAGNLQLKTAAPLEEVAAFYREKLAAESYTVEETSSTAADTRMFTFAGQNESLHRTVLAVCVNEGADTTVTLTFSEEAAQ